MSSPEGQPLDVNQQADAKPLPDDLQATSLQNTAAPDEKPDTDHQTMEVPTQPAGNVGPPASTVEAPTFVAVSTDGTKTHDVTSPFVPETASEMNQGQISESLYDGRPVRSKTLTEKGAQYAHDTAITAFKNCLKNVKRHNTLAIHLIESDQPDIRGLYECRDNLERLINELSAKYYCMGDFSRTSLMDHKTDFDDCLTRNASTMFNVTQAIRRLQGDSRSQSHRSGHSSKSKSTGSTKSSSKPKSRHSSVLSTASMKAQAAAKAAALHAQLKYHEVESEQKAQLTKTQLLREIEVEEAKFAAISRVESRYDTAVNGSLSELVTNTQPMRPVPVVSSYQSVDVTNYVTSSSANLPVTSQNAAPVNVTQNLAATVPMSNHVTVSNTVPVNSTHVVSSTVPINVSQAQPTSMVNSLNFNAPEFIPNYTQTIPNSTLPGDQPTTSSQPYITEHSQIPVSNADSFAVSGITVGLKNLIGSLGEFMNLSRLPIPEPGIFTGNPIEYPSWRSAFKTLVESRNIPPAECIHYLKRYLGGTAEQCVAGFLLIPTAEAYHEAMNLIDQRFGNKFAVAQAFKMKLQEWPKISARDAIGLQRFSDFLCQCEVASRSNESLRILDDDIINHDLVLKLPDWLSSRWAREVHRFRTLHNAFPKFALFVNFIKNEAAIACEPIALSKSVSTSVISKTVNAVGRSLNTSVSEKEGCLYCDGKNHSFENCNKFKSRTSDDKSAFIKQKGLCFGCLKRGHLSKDCKGRSKCNDCGKRHPTVLHSDEFKLTAANKSGHQSIGSKELSNANRKDGRDQKSEAKLASDKHVSLLTYDSHASKSTMIVPVYLSHSSHPDREVLTYALLDTQSDMSYISEETASNLGISGVETTIVLSTMTAENYPMKSARISGISARSHESDLNVPLPTLYSIDNIPVCKDNIPTPQMVNSWPHLQPVGNHLMPKSDCNIGLLIGYNCPRALVPREVIPPVGDGPFAMKTDLGWGIVGLITNVENAHSDSITHHVCSKETGSHIVLRTGAREVMSPAEILQFFGREEGIVSAGKGFSQDDLRFLTIMQEGVRKTEDGHYELPLPLRNSSEPPVYNRVIALHRLQALIKRFKKDSQHYEHYKKFMQDLFQKGYAEEVPKCEMTRATHSCYLPHHGVYNSAKPGKVRVVMDGSAQYQGQSLNNQLLKGPDLMNTLLGVLCRFRKERIALTCDIEAMFQQFRVPPEHRNYLRFLWFENDDYESQPRDYRSTVHLFGAASSPAVANFALQRAAADNIDKFSSDTVTFIQRDFYVDDGITSLSSEDEAIRLVHESIQLTAECGLRLHKFVCNSSKVLDSIDKDRRAEAVKDIDFKSNSLTVERALGVSWCIENDQLKFRIVVHSHALTRRGVLSTVCSMFDPLGLLAPVVLKGKIILQTLCKDHLGWDDPLPDSIRSQWEMWLQSLTQLTSLGINRCYKPENFGELKRCELHNFSDACLSGYGQCS
jgi:hypothetical protein